MVWQFTAQIFLLDMVFLAILYKFDCYTYIQSQAIKFALATIIKYQNCCANFLVNEALIVKISQLEIPVTLFKDIIPLSTVGCLSVKLLWR